MSQPFGTGYVNLNQYLDANRQGLANTANTLASSDVAAAQAAKDEAARVGYQGYDAARAAGAGSVVDPTSLPDFADAQAKAMSAQENLQGLSNPGGVAQQLSASQGAGYTPGQRGFDTALLGGSRDAQSTFHQAQGRFSGLDTYLMDQAKQGIANGQARAAENNQAPVGSTNNTGPGKTIHNSGPGMIFDPNYTPPPVAPAQGPAGDTANPKKYTTPAENPGTSYTKPGTYRGGTGGSYTF